MKARRKFWINDTEAICVITLALTIIGLFNVSSSSLIFSFNNYRTPYHFLYNYAMWAAVGGVICFLIARWFNYRHLSSFRLLVSLIVISFILLILVKLVGINVNGSRRWLNLGFMNFQPSEFIKLVSIIIVSLPLSNFIKNKRPIKLQWNSTWPFVVCLGLAWVVETQPDFGTALIIILIPLMLYFIAGLSAKYLYFLIPTVIAVGTLCIYLMSYRAARIRYWLNPWANAEGGGYQSVQSMLAIGSGGFHGLGFGYGLSKYSYLPEAHTDFAAAIYAQEFGFIGIIVLCFLFMALTYYCTRIALTIRDPFGKLLVYGCMLLITVQAIINLLMVAGVLPIVGVPLPFISYGGTSLLLNMISIGLILSVIRCNAKETKLQQRRQNPSVATRRPSTTTAPTGTNHLHRIK